MKKPDFKAIISKIKITPAELGVVIVVLSLAALVIVPSLVQCAVNRNKAKCSNHMYRMLGIISDELYEETKNGGTYWRDLIQDGNYQKLITSLNDKTGEADKFPSSDYYIRTGADTLSIVCKKHKDVSEKQIKFALMQDVEVEISQRPILGEEIMYLKVSGPDTYFQHESLDADNPSKMVFHGLEVDKAIENLTVTAVYSGGAREVLPRSRYTISTDKLDMSKAGQTKLIIKSNTTSLWDNSASTSFVIDVIGEDDVAPLIVDGGLNGKFELASWEWSDYVYEASLEETGKSFGASIVRYNGNYYYYTDGMTIINDYENTSPMQYALDTEDSAKTAYCIKFDTDSVILTQNDADKIHNGSIKVENDLIYIWQEASSKTEGPGWIRVYCDLTKY